MGIESHEAQNHVSNHANRVGGGNDGGGGQDRNAVAYRLGIAKSLYEQIQSLRRFLAQTSDDFTSLFNRHNVLLNEFFFNLVEENIKPRKLQIETLAEHVNKNDVNQVKGIVSRYIQATQGIASGTSAAANYFAAINLNQANQLGQLAANLGNADCRDYHTQLAVAYSIKKTFEALQQQLDTTGRKYHECATSHDELMKQDFDNFIKNNCKPTIEQLQIIYRNVRNVDIPKIDNIIQRIKAMMND